MFTLQIFATMSQSNTNSKEEENTEIIRALEAYDYVRLCWVDLNGIHLSKLVSTKFAKKIINGDCEVYSGIISFGPRMEVSWKLGNQLTLCTSSENWPSYKRL